MNDWTDDIENVLECIRQNAVILHREHQKQYFSLKSFLQYFRLPIIIISGINSVVSVGTTAYLEQKTVSLMTCILALVCSIIGSIELYLSIQKRMETELIGSRDFYILSVDIQKTLLLGREHRPIPAKDYLEKSYNTYIKLIENSNLLNKKISDKLTPLPTGTTAIMPPTPTSSKVGLNLEVSTNSEISAV